MKALVAVEPGKLEFREVPVPEVGPYDVLSKVSYVGICGTDVALMTGNTSFVESGQARYPIRLGHEWSGIVEKVGSEVKHVVPGDHIIADDGVPCGNCEACFAGDFGACQDTKSVGTVGDHWPGAFADYMLMPGRLVHKIGKMDMAEAALIEPACIALYGIKKSGASLGDTVMIIGTGPIGLAGVGITHAMGTRVILVGRRDSKLKYGKTMGADILLNSATQNIEEELKKLLPESNGKVDAIVETSGNAEIMMQTSNFIKRGRNVALVGFYEKKLNGFDIDAFVMPDVNIMGSAGTVGTIPVITNLLNMGKLSLKPLISKIYPFSQAIEAFDHVVKNDGDRIKVLVKMDD